MLPLVYDPLELADKAKNNRGQMNYSIVKSELGKLRITVTSDLYTYLQMSWVNVFFDNCYLTISGSTLEESPDDEIRRFFVILKALTDHYGIPFDYDKFDRQPTTAEIIWILICFFDRVQARVPPAHKAEFYEITENILFAFRHSKIGIKAEDVFFAVLGGLMSGIRWTSLIGNVWNTINSSVVIRFVDDLTDKYVSETLFYIRGDDSLLLTRDLGVAYLTASAYSVFGIEGGAGKFSVQSGSAEFLRQWFVGKSVIGYYARSVPTLSQNKPWSNTPWSPENELKNVIDSLNVLRRRGCSARIARIFCDVVVEQWSRRRGIPSFYCSLPTYYGGLGLLSSTMMYDFIGPRIPTFIPRTASLQVRRSNWLDKIIRTQVSEYGLSPTPEELDFATKQHLLSLVSSDDIPSFAAFFRSQYAKDLLTRQFSSARRLNVVLGLDIRLGSVFAEVVKRITRIKWLEEEVLALKNTELAVPFSTAVSKMIKEKEAYATLGRDIPKFCGQALWDLSVWTRFKLRREEAVALVTHSYTIVSSSVIHPLFLRGLTNMTVNTVIECYKNRLLRPKKHAFSMYCSVLFSMVEDAWVHSPTLAQMFRY